MSIGVYEPGTSLLHRAAPSIKLITLAAYAVALSLADQQVVFGALIAVLLIAWAVSGLAWAKLSQCLKPLTWIFAGLFVFQTVVAGVFTALDTLGTIAALVAAAALVSHTTRTDDMLETLTTAFSAFARFGLNPQTPAFAMVFTIRLVPFVATVGREAIAARMARGARRNPLPALVPIAIRLMRETDAMAEALVARGFGQP